MFLLVIIQFWQAVEKRFRGGRCKAKIGEKAQFMLNK